MSVKDFANWFYNPVSTVGTVVSVIANFFGLNVKNFDEMYSKSEDLRKKVDRLAEDYLRKYEDKVAISTPSTTPTLAKFISSQLEKDKDVVLAMQRKIQQITDSIEREKSNPIVDISKRDKLNDQLKEAENTFNEGMKNLSNSKKTQTIVQGAQNRFTNAQRVKNWKDKQQNVQKETK